MALCKLAIYNYVTVRFEGNVSISVPSFWCIVSGHVFVSSFTSLISLLSFKINMYIPEIFMLNKLL